MMINNNSFENLSGKVLIATPNILKGIFEKSLIYVLSHKSEGSIGLMFNHFVSYVDVKDFFHVRDDVDGNDVSVPLYLGGQVEHDRAFFLHSDDYNKNKLIRLDNNLLLTSNSKISQDIANNKGPKQTLCILGYTSWNSLQLEDEIKRNFWIVADCSADFILSESSEDKWDDAIKSFGVTLSNFSSIMGKM